jgi:hypothetical protein
VRFALLLIKSRYNYPVRFCAALCRQKKGSHALGTDFADAGGCPDAALRRRFSGHPLAFGIISKKQIVGRLARTGDALLEGLMRYGVELG